MSDEFLDGRKSAWLMMLRHCLSGLGYKSEQGVKAALILEREEAIAQLVEDCGTFLNAAGKAQRLGLKGVSPELPKNQQEKNIHGVYCGIAKLRQAMVDFERAIGEASL